MYNDYSPPKANVAQRSTHVFRVAPAIVAMISASGVMFALAAVASLRRIGYVVTMNAQGVGLVLVCVALTGALVLLFQKLPTWMAAIVGPGLALALLFGIALAAFSLTRYAA